LDSDAQKGISISYIKVLKDIGSDNLNKAIDEVPGLDDDGKNKFKGYVKKICESKLNRPEYLTGKEVDFTPQE